MRIPICLVSNLRRNSTIADLQSKFKDPTSPYHIPPGTNGPESPDAPPETSHETLDTPFGTKDLSNAKQKLFDNGLDPSSFWTQAIVWGDQDPFQHVNNVRYVRFFESARIKWMLSLGQELEGPKKAYDMLRGRGVSLILKSIEVQFRRPVTYPDTLLIGYRPLPPSSEDPALLNVKASAYSLSQKAFVAHSKEALVWYDYDKLKKADPGQRIKDIILRRTKFSENS